MIYDLHRDYEVANTMYQEQLEALYMAVRQHLHSNPYIIQNHCETVEAYDRKRIAAYRAWRQAQQEAA